MQKAASNTCKTITVSHSAIRHFLARLHSLVTAVAAGISVALTVLTAGAAATAIASKSTTVAGWKRYRWFVKYIAKGGDNLEAILRKQKRKDVIVQLLAIPEPYQHQDYMRQLMDFALQTAKSYDLPLVIETDEKLKCDKCGHFGVKLVNKRDFGDDRYGYGMICEN